MRTLRPTILIVVTIAASVLFLVQYTRTVHWLLSDGLETGDASFAKVCFNLRNDINVVVWSAFPQARPWAHNGWSLFYYGDAPEGTKAVLYFPSWYLLVPLLVILSYGLFDIFKHYKKRAT